MGNPISHHDEPTCDGYSPSSNPDDLLVHENGNRIRQDVSSEAAGTDINAECDENMISREDWPMHATDELDISQIQPSAIQDLNMVTTAPAQICHVAEEDRTRTFMQNIGGSNVPLNQSLGHILDFTKESFEDIRYRLMERSLLPDMRMMESGTTPCHVLQVTFEPQEAFLLQTLYNLLNQQFLACTHTTISDQIDGMMLLTEDYLKLTGGINNPKMYMLNAV
jgi:hypothetical protein